MSDWSFWRRIGTAGVLAALIGGISACGQAAQPASDDRPDAVQDDGTVIGGKTAFPTSFDEFFAAVDDRVALNCTVSFPGGGYWVVQTDEGWASIHESSAQTSPPWAWENGTPPPDAPDLYISHSLALPDHSIYEWDEWPEPATPMSWEDRFYSLDDLEGLDFSLRNLASSSDQERQDDIASGASTLTCHAPEKADFTRPDAK